MSDERPTTPVSVHLVRTTSNRRDEDYYRLEVKDERSLERIAIIQLESAKVADLISSRLVHVEAEVTPHPERVGRKRVRLTVPVPDEAMPDYRTKERDAEHWARARMVHDGGVFTDLQMGPTPRGMYVDYLRWEDPA